MTTEELKIKVSLETQKLKNELRQLKQSLKELKIDSQNKKESDELAKSLEKVENTLRDIDRIDIGDNLANGFDKAKKKAKEVSSAVSGINGGSVNIDGADNLGEQFTQIQGSLEAIKALSFAEVFATLGGNMAFLKGSVSSLGAGFGELKQGVGLALSALNPFSRFAKKNDVGKGLGASLDHIKEGFSGLKMHVGAAKKNFSAFFASIPKGAAVAAAAIAAIIASIIAVKNAITQAKQVAQTAYAAEKIGMTASAYGEWGYVITQLGGEIDDLTDYIRTLSAAQNEVRAGSEDTIAAFARLGMSAEEISGMSQSEMFSRTIMGLQNVKDEVERVSLAYKIFGEDDGAKVTTLLNTNNAEIQQMIQNYRMLGGVMSADLIHNSKVLTGALGNLSTAWTGLKNTLAEVFLPIIIPVVQWLTKAVAIVNMFIRAIFGKEIVAASSGITNVASAYTGYTDSANQATNATNKVTEAVERLKRVTMGFDELNKLPGVDKTGSSSSGDTGNGGVSQLPSGGTVGGLDLPTTEDLGLDGIAKWFEKYQSKIADWTAILLTLGGIALAVFCFLHGNIVGGIAGLALAGMGIVVGTQDGGIWDRLFEGIKGVWGKIKTWFGEHVKPVFTKEWWVNLFDKVRQGAAEKLDNVKTTISEKWGVIKEWFNTTIKPIFTKQYWLDKFDKIKEGSSASFDKFKTTGFYKFLTGLKDRTVSLTAKFKETGASVRKAVTKAVDKFKTKTATLTAKFKEKGSTIRKNIVKAWDKIYTKTRTLTAKFREQGARKTISNAWDKFKSKTSTLTVTFKDAFTSAIKRAWNGLVTAINGAIGYINKIPKVNIPKLPYLATGGIVTSATTAVIGEAGREAVLPLDRNTGWMDALAEKIAARNGGGGGGPTKIILTVDGKQLGWATIDNINSITKQTGTLPLKLV